MCLPKTSSSGLRPGLFVERVAEGRGSTYEEIDELAQGRVWTGAQAKEIGLIDIIGNSAQAIRLAAEMAGIEAYTVVEYPKQKAPFEELMDVFMMRVKGSIIKEELAQAYPYYKYIQSILNMDVLQTRLPEFIMID